MKTLLSFFLIACIAFVYGCSGTLPENAITHSGDGGDPQAPMVVITAGNVDCDVSDESMVLTGAPDPVPAGFQYHIFMTHDAATTAELDAEDYDYIIVIDDMEMVWLELYDIWVSQFGTPTTGYYGGFEIRPFEPSSRTFGTTYQGFFEFEA